MYLSTSKTIAILLLFKYFFGQCFVLYFAYFFVQATKVLLDYTFRILLTFYTFYFLHFLLFTLFTFYTFYFLHFLLFTLFTFYTFYFLHFLLFTLFTFYTFYFLHFTLFTQLLLDYFCSFWKFSARLKTKFTIFVKRNLQPLLSSLLRKSEICHHSLPKLKRYHSLALLIETQDAFGARLSARKVLTLFEWVLSLKELDNSSNWLSGMTQSF